MLTRKRAKKVIDIDLAFSPIDVLPKGQLPTKSDVIKRLLKEKNWHTRETAFNVAQEVIDIWMHCTVYPISKKQVTDKIMKELVQQLGKLRKYPKRKKVETYCNNVKKFVAKSDELFDIFIHDKAKLATFEIKHKLKMTEQEYWFYEDQKGPRSAKCLNIKEKLTGSDFRFARRILNYPINETPPDIPSTSADTMVYSATESEISSVDSTDTTIFEPPVKSAKLCQNRQSYRNLAKCCDRYNLSDRVGAALATSVLMDHGLVSNTNQSFAIDRNKLRREREKYRFEIQPEEDQLFQHVDGIYMQMVKRMQPLR